MNSAATRWVSATNLFDTLGLHNIADRTTTISDSFDIGKDSSFQLYGY